jgi:hypothetical protein
MTITIFVFSFVGIGHRTERHRQKSLYIKRETRREAALSGMREINSPELGPFDVND